MTFWTQNKIDQLIELKNDLSAKDIAEKLGTTKRQTTGNMSKEMRKNTT